MVLALVLACALPAAVAHPAQPFIAQYAMTIKQTLQADAEMYRQIELVSHKLEQFYGRLGHFPQTDTEVEFFKKVVGKYVVSNPYKPQVTDRITGKPVAEPYTVPLYIFNDGNITTERMRQFLKKPPEAWQAEPGSIFILTDDANAYLIWAASADRLPVRDFSTTEQKPRMIAKLIHRSVE